MTVGVQLTFTGEEIPIEVSGARGRRLTVSQRAVLRYLDEHLTIRPKQAGLVHYEAIGNVWPGEERYASNSGFGLLDRMLRRGLVRRVERGVYVSCLDSS